MIRHLLSRVRRVLPASSASATRLEQEINELRADINELRMDNLRIAQLHDAVVDGLAELQRTKSIEGSPHAEP